MKRLFIIFFAILFLVLLNGCNFRNQTSSSENEAPVVSGETDLEFDIHSDVPDWKIYVSAEDEEDGSILITDDMIEADGVDFTVEGSYQVLYYVYDSDGNTTQYIIQVEIVDNRTYTFQLISSQVMTVEVHDSFTDPGVTALDLDGSIAIFQVEGAVDTSVVGAYTLTYSMNGFDQTLTRTVHVVDTTAPVILNNDILISMDQETMDWTEFDFTIEDNYSTSFTVELLADTIVYGTQGSYTITIRASDEFGNSATKVVFVTVGHVLANGKYDLSTLSSEDRANILIEMERYLIENVIGGVPLFRRSSFTIFSSRVDVYSEIYNGVMEFGSDFSTLTADDSNVLLYNNVFGNTDEYTWRDAIQFDPSTLNPWMADTSHDEEIISKFTGALYDFYFDDSLTGFKINASLAAGDPIPVDPVIIDGKIYAKVWQITLRDDLEWAFHPDTNLSGLAAGYETLDASDYLWTWKYAMDNDWFRARTGGGDFISQGIKGAAEYINGTEVWSNVGLRIATGTPNTIELEYINEKSAFEIKYGFAGATLTPICQELLEDLGVENYGMDPESVASSGVYVFDTWTPGQLLTFTKNPLHPDSGMYHYTGYQYHILNDAEGILNEFLAGRLDVANIPDNLAHTYVNYPNVYARPNSTTWSLEINGFGTEEARDEYISQYPEMGLDESWVPEPILMYTEMKQALYYGVDRYELAVNVAGTYLPAYTYFSPIYFIDAESGISIHGTENAIAMLEEFGGDSYGYYPIEAVRLFKEAVAQAISDGYYSGGTPSDPTIIELELFYFSNGNEYIQTYVAEMVNRYEDLLVDDENFVKIDIIVNDIAFPSGYSYHPIMQAGMDLGLGGISTCLLCESSILDIYCDNNPSGLTLNWGIDTHTANIEIEYTNQDGKKAYELWSYNALTNALAGSTYVRDGQIQTDWDSVIDLINAYLDMSGEVLESSSDDATLAGYVLGESMENIATSEGFDSMSAIIVVTDSGKHFLFVISLEGNQYQLYAQLRLATSADEAIQNHIYSYGYYVTLDLAVGPLTDAEIVANAYLITLGAGYTSIAEIAIEVGAPAEFVEIYATTIHGSGAPWDDSYVVLHIGGYYIGWKWL